MKLINKSRGTGKTTQLIYASAITGFRIIAPSAALAKHIEEMAKNMGLKIPQPLPVIEYRSREVTLGSHAPILIDDVEYKILEEALELYFKAPVVAATMTVPIDDDCVPPTPKPLVYDHKTEKIRPMTNQEEVIATLTDLLTSMQQMKMESHSDKEMWNNAIGVCQGIIQDKINELKEEK